MGLLDWQLDEHQTVGQSPVLLALVFLALRRGGHLVGVSRLTCRCGDASDDIDAALDHAYSEATALLVASGELRPEAVAAFVHLVHNLKAGAERITLDELVAVANAAVLESEEYL